MELRPVWRLRLVVGGIWGGATAGKMSASAARHGQAARAIMMTLNAGAIIAGNEHWLGVLAEYRTAVLVLDAFAAS